MPRVQSLEQPESRQRTTLITREAHGQIIGRDRGEPLPKPNPSDQAALCG